MGAMVDTVKIKRQIVKAIEAKEIWVKEKIFANT
jgi:hypothetical protein